MTNIQRPGIKQFVARSRRVSGFIGTRIFPQWTRTALVLLLWLAASTIWVRAVCVYSNYGGGLMACVGLAFFTAITTHLWPTRTSQWRTLFWAFIISILIGAFGLLGGLGRFALDASLLATVLFVVLRLNQNARRLVHLVKAYRITR